ncbi:P1 family peptidase, partial [Corynebacterium heidelbergense]
AVCAEADQRSEDVRSNAGSDGASVVQPNKDSRSNVGTRSSCIGAGRGSTAGALKGGFGQASAVFPEGTALAGHVVAAAVVTNPQGSVFDPTTGLPWGIGSEMAGEFAVYELSILGRRDEWGRVAPLNDAAIRRLVGCNIAGTKFPVPENGAGSVSTSADPHGGPQTSTQGDSAPTPPSPQSQCNTTIGIIATTAPMTKAQAKRLAMAAHDGLARAVRPAHMPMDGDTFFALSLPASGECETGGTQDDGKNRPKLDPASITPMQMTMLSAVAAQAVERAIVHSVLAAEPMFDVLSWSEIAEHFGGVDAGTEVQR